MKNKKILKNNKKINKQTQIHTIFFLNFPRKNENFETIYPKLDCPLGVI